ncbi:MAG TPA: peptidase S16 [Thiotrichales bacterium]|nr:peptidase S16 [Thiotrichales bacterium]
MRYALFPLHTVLFPGSVLPLQIFEQRYIRLVTDCMRKQHGFVTVLISEGKEVGDTPEIYNVGCYVDITDWETLPNGLLGITIEARHRCRLFNLGVKDDGLLMAEAESIDTDTSDEPDTGRLPERYLPLADTLEQLLRHPFAEEQRQRVNFQSARDVCYRLCELLPISNEQKQILLEVPTLDELLDQTSVQIQALQKQAR